MAPSSSPEPGPGSAARKWGQPTVVGSVAAVAKVPRGHWQMQIAANCPFVHGQFGAFAGCPRSFLLPFYSSCIRAFRIAIRVRRASIAANRPRGGPGDGWPRRWVALAMGGPGDGWPRRSLAGLRLFAVLAGTGHSMVDDCILIHIHCGPVCEMVFSMRKVPNPDSIRRGHPLRPVRWLNYAGIL